MQRDRANSDDIDTTHFWIYCPGCAYAGKIGVPVNHPADVVVCPQCHQVVNVRPEDRILWEPASPTDFLKERFPHNDWDETDNANLPPPAPPAAAQGERGRMTAVAKILICLAVAVCAFFVLTAIVVVSGQIYHGQFQ